MIAVLERQIAHFSSDDFLRERAAEYRGTSPEECWAATLALCRDLEWLVDRMDPATRERALAPEPLSDELVSILEALQCR